MNYKTPQSFKDIQSCPINPKTENKAIKSYNAKVTAKHNSGTISLLQVRAMEIFLMQNKFKSIKEYNASVTKFNGQNYLLKQREYKTPNNAITTQKKGVVVAKQYYLPTINQPEFSKINKAYKEAALKFNAPLLAYNKSVKNYNSLLRKNQADTPLTATEKDLVNTFKIQHKDYTPKAYNDVAKRFNKDNKKLLVTLKKQQVLLPQHKLTFQTLLGIYSKQFSKQFRYYRKIGIKQAMPLPKLRITYGRIASQVGYDSKKTIQNHVKMLIKAGILTDYKFINSQKPVEMAISANLLTIYDVEMQKKINTQNQFVKSKRSKSLHNDNDTNIIILKRNKKKENVDNISSIKGNSLSLIHNDFFYQNTSKQNAKKNKAPVAKFSDYLANFLISDKQLAKNLTNNNYASYQQIDSSLLKHEVMYGTMSREDFKTLITQEFVKIAANLWKNHSVYEGNWLKTLYFFNDTLFFNHNGEILKKETMLEQLKEYKWRLNYVKGWVRKKNKTDLLFPYQYFDPNRKLSSEMGFRFTGQAYRRYKKALLNRQKEAKNRTFEAQKRQADYKDTNKANKAIQRFTAGKYSTDQLYKYFQDNLSPHFLERLPALIAGLRKN